MIWYSCERYSQLRRIWTDTGILRNSFVALSEDKNVTIALQLTPQHLKILIKKSYSKIVQFYIGKWWEWCKRIKLSSFYDRPNKILGEIYNFSHRFWLSLNVHSLYCFEHARRAVGTWLGNVWLTQKLYLKARSLSVTACEQISSQCVLCSRTAWIILAVQRDRLWNSIYEKILRAMVMRKSDMKFWAMVSSNLFQTSTCNILRGTINFFSTYVTIKMVVWWTFMSN